jgi:hypothetical protein
MRGEVYSIQLYVTDTMRGEVYSIQLYVTDTMRGEVYSIQLYVVEFVSYLRQVGGFLRVLRFHPPTKLTATI